MYRKITPSKTSLRVNDSKEGERIEQKVNRILNNKEPIKDGAPRIYTDRKDGIIPEYNIRTDRFEEAIDATDKITKSKLAKRQDDMNKRLGIGEQAQEGMKKEGAGKQGNGGAEPSQAT